MGKRQPGTYGDSSYYKLGKESRGKERQRDRKKRERERATVKRREKGVEEKISK